MATVSIKLSQTVVDAQQVLAQQAATFDGSLGSLVDMFGAAGNTVDQNLQLASWNLSGSTLRVNYTNGATETYVGVVQDNPYAVTGHASATGYTYEQNGVLNLSGTGKFNFDYSMATGNTWLEPSAQGHIVNTLRVATELPAGSANYDPVFGNVAIGLNGTLNLTAQGTVSGIVTSLTVGADKLLASSTIDGQFQIDSSRPDGISGLLSGYQEHYYDGSTVQIAGLSAGIGASQGLDDGIWTNPAYFSGNDDVSVDLPARLYSAVTLDTGTGDDRISLNGGGGQLGVRAGAGNDRITLLGDAHTVDGGSGIDTVQLASARAAYGIVHAGGGQLVYTVTGPGGTVDQLTDVERLVFSDGAYALDVDGNAGQAYRVYQAAFNRAPDASGLGFWINALDHGTSLESVARGFAQSDEFVKAYGAAPSHHDLVTRFYENILHRTPDAGGLDFWVAALDGNQAEVPAVLAAISESAENKAALVGVIGNGFAYTPYGQG